VSAAPLVSTIIPVFNRPAMLAEAVASVLAQSWRPIEIIIVDDGSTDGTAAVADRLASEHEEVRVIHRPNGGVGAAREAGRTIARGAYLQYLDSDDLLLPGKFALQVTGLEQHPECGVAYGWTRLRRRDGGAEPQPWKGSGQRVATMFPRFLQWRWWDTPTPLYRASLCAAAGPWTTLRMEEDWEYDCRIAARGVALYYVEDWVAEVRVHGEGQLSGGADALSPAKLRDRAAAHLLILQHARAAGIPAEAPERRHFERELFLLARQCGAAGLPEESRRLYLAAREQDDRAVVRAYGLVARLVGWRAAGTLAALTDRLRW
jgi:glycosyltransferase involved in cell wall biosynthesis